MEKIKTMKTIINTKKIPIKVIPKSVQTPIAISWLLSLLFLISTIIYFFLSQPELPLFYSVATKRDQLAPKVFLFILPTVSLVINLVHFFIVKALKKFSVVLLKLFVGTTITIQVLIGFALFRIILITI